MGDSKLLNYIIRCMVLRLSEGKFPIKHKIVNFLDTLFFDQSQGTFQFKFLNYIIHCMVLINSLFLEPFNVNISDIYRDLSN